MFMLVHLYMKPLIKINFSLYKNFVMKLLDIELKGTHDVDSGWMKEVRDTGAKIVPRVANQILLHFPVLYRGFTI